MGARAHGRRHEGRAIRRFRRRIRAASLAFASLGQATVEAARLVDSFAAIVQEALQQAQGARSEAAPPCPTREGVEAVRSPQEARWVRGLS